MSDAHVLIFACTWVCRCACVITNTLTTQDTDENVEFQSTILSRFDLIFVVKDEHNESRDIALARHVMGVHLNAMQEPKEGEMDVALLKK